jgi:hypothetical protein
MPDISIATSAPSAHRVELRIGVVLEAGVVVAVWRRIRLGAKSAQGAHLSVIATRVCDVDQKIACEGPSPRVPGER